MSGILSAMTELIHDNEKVIGYIHITRMFVDPSSKCFQSVAQLAERSLPTPEIRGLTPSSAKYYNLSTKMKIKSKEAENGPSLKKSSLIQPY